jgi:hypothetical protein
MSWTELRLPKNVVVKGALPTGQLPRDLVDDMLEIDLPDGTTIDVGWVPEHDPRGAYRIVVFRDYWVNQVEEPLYTRSRERVLEALLAIVRERTRPRFAAGSGLTEVPAPEWPAPGLRAVRYKAEACNA